MRNRNLKKGFTLVELIVALAASVIVMGACASILAVGFRVFSHSDTAYTAHQLAALTIGELKNELEFDADAVNIPQDAASGGSYSWPKQPYAAKTTYLYSDKASGRLIMAEATDSATLTVQKTFLEGLYPDYRLKLNFKKTTAGTLEVDVTITDKNWNTLYDTSTDIIVNNQKGSIAEEVPGSIHESCVYFTPVS